MFAYWRSYSRWYLHDHWLELSYYRYSVHTSSLSPSRPSIHPPFRARFVCTLFYSSFLFMFDLNKSWSLIRLNINPLVLSFLPSFLLSRFRSRFLSSLLPSFLSCLLSLFLSFLLSFFICCFLCFLYSSRPPPLLFVHLSMYTIINIRIYKYNNSFPDETRNLHQADVNILDWDRCYSNVINPNIQNSSAICAGHINKDGYCQVLCELYCKSELHLSYFSSNYLTRCTYLDTCWICMQIHNFCYSFSYSLY